MEGRQLVQYLIDTSDVVLAKKQEATEYLAKLEAAQPPRAVDGAKCVAKTGRYMRHLYKHGICVRCGTHRH